MKAFPTTRNDEITGIWQTEDGMDLRDYFAAKVLPALLFDINAISIDPIKTAKLAYAYADVMMEARK